MEILVQHRHVRESRSMQLDPCVFFLKKKEREREREKKSFLKGNVVAARISLSQMSISMNGYLI
jgi:hypothetical protein